MGHDKLELKAESTLKAGLFCYLFERQKQYERVGKSLNSHLLVCCPNSRTEIKVSPVDGRDPVTWAATRLPGSTLSGM